MKHFCDLSWTDVLDDIFTVNQGNETEQTIALGRNENGEHFLCRLPESEKQGFPVLLICENGKNMKTRTTLFPQGKEGLSFQWAKEALPAIHAALLKTLRSAEGEKLFDLFQKQGGLLALCENDADELLLQRSLQTDDIQVFFEKDEDFPLILGAALSDMPVILLSAKEKAPDKAASNFLHELTHRVESVSAFSDSLLFKEILDLEAAHQPPLYQKISRVLNNFIVNENYDSDERNQELFARLHEEKFKNPSEFEKQMPLLNIFYNNIVYPTIDSYLLGHKRTKSFFDSFMQKELLSKTEKETFEKNQRKINEATRCLEADVEKQETTSSENARLLKRAQADQMIFTEKLLPILAFRLKAQIESHAAFHKRKDEEDLSQNPTNQLFMEQVKKAAWRSCDEYKNYLRQKGNALFPSAALLHKSR